MQSCIFQAYVRNGICLNKQRHEKYFLEEVYNNILHCISLVTIVWSALVEYNIWRGDALYEICHQAPGDQIS